MGVLNYFSNPTILKLPDDKEFVVDNYNIIILSLWKI